MIFCCCWKWLHPQTPCQLVLPKLLPATEREEILREKKGDIYPLLLCQLAAERGGGIVEWSSLENCSTKRVLTVKEEAHAAPAPPPPLSLWFQDIHNCTKSKPDVSKMGKPPRRKLQIYAEQPVWCNIICNEHSQQASHALYTPVFQCFLLINVCDLLINTASIFLLKPKGQGELLGSLLLFQYSLVLRVVSTQLVVFLVV